MRPRGPPARETVAARQIVVHPERHSAYAWQHRRFDGDVEFWRQRLSEPDGVEAVKGGRSLRFWLRSAADFAAFQAAVSGELTRVVFRGREDGEVG